MSVNQLPLQPNALAVGWALEYASQFNVARVLDAVAADNFKLLRAVLLDLLPEDQERCLLNFSYGMIVNLFRNPSKLESMPASDFAYIVDLMADSTPGSRSIHSSFFSTSTELKAWVTMYFARICATHLFQDAVDTFFSPTAAVNDAAVGEPESDAAKRKIFYAQLNEDFRAYAANISILRDAACPANQAEIDAAIVNNKPELASELTARMRAAAAALPQVPAATAAVDALECRHTRDLALNGASSLYAYIRDERGWRLEALGAVISGLQAPAEWSVSEPAVSGTLPVLGTQISDTASIVAASVAASTGGDLSTFNALPLEAAKRGASQI